MKQASICFRSSSASTRSSNSPASCISHEYPLLKPCCDSETNPITTHPPPRQTEFDFRWGRSQVFHMWESSRTVLLVGWFSLGVPCFSPSFQSDDAPYLHRFNPRPVWRLVVWRTQLGARCRSKAASMTDVK
ncbi:hypothetical protein PR048_009723 [Dryococelus australis]|uniref:Uncharacterized protein n=1 Tax=Dryococelus australis TaxID=614101 RepID=A0ABQ9I1R4_9NEOP|nr:hypothetical protein PR048_009723 [Dryococelus australis]